MVAQTGSGLEDFILLNGASPRSLAAVAQLNAAIVCYSIVLSNYFSQTYHNLILLTNREQRVEADISSVSQRVANTKVYFYSNPTLTKPSG